MTARIKIIMIGTLITVLCLVGTGCGNIGQFRQMIGSGGSQEINTREPAETTQETQHIETTTEAQVTTTAETTAEPQPVYNGKGKFRGLEISVSAKTPEKVDISLVNTSSDGYSLGWVNGPTITLITSDDEYYYTAPMMLIKAGESGNLTGYFENATGEMLSVKISNMNLLTSTGLPSDTKGGDTIEIVFGEDTSDGNKTEAPIEKKSGSGDFQGLEIQASATDPQKITVEYTNNTSGGYSLGWVGGLTITCTTSTGEYYFSSNMAKLEAGDSIRENYYFDNASGDLISIYISGIHVLNESGLPSDFGAGGSVTIYFE